MTRGGQANQQSRTPHAFDAIRKYDGITLRAQSNMVTLRATLTLTPR